MKFLRDMLFARIDSKLDRAFHLFNRYRKRQYYRLKCSVSDERFCQMKQAFFEVAELNRKDLSMREVTIFYLLVLKLSYMYGRDLESIEVPQNEHALFEYMFFGA